MKLPRLAAVAAGLVLLALPASAQADATVTLCDLQNQIDLDLKANVLGEGLFAVHAVLHEPTKDILASGTGILEGNTVRVGITLHNLLNGFIPVEWEFSFDLTTLEGSGEFEWLTLDEVFGPLTFGPGPCVPVEGVARNPLALGKR